MDSTTTCARSLVFRVRGGGDAVVDAPDGGDDDGVEIEVAEEDTDASEDNQKKEVSSSLEYASTQVGEDSLNNAELDAYVDALIKEYEERTHTPDAGSEASTEKEKDPSATLKEESASAGLIGNAKDEEQWPRTEGSEEEGSEQGQIPSEKSTGESQQSLDTPLLPEAGSSSSPKKVKATKSKKKKKKRISAPDSSHAEEETAGSGAMNATSTVEASGAMNATSPVSAETGAQLRQPSVHEPSEEMELVLPPNAFYRFLLNRGGPVGHMLVTTLVVTRAFFDVYFPIAPAVILWVLQKTQIYDYRRHVALAKRRQSQQRQRGLSVSPGRGRDVNTKYGGIVSADTMTGASKRAAKLQVRAADQTAMDQLRQVGNIDAAKYRLLSKDFMQRHLLGMYKPEDDAPPLRGIAKSLSREVGTLSSEEESDIPSLALDDLVANDNDGEADDADNDDWVVQALLQETEKDVTDEKRTSRKRRLRQPDTSISIGADSRGRGRMEVGLEFNFGSTPSSPRSAMLEAAAASRASKSSSAKKSKVRRSDRAGGGGVFGQLRAFHANNAVSARLFGAYPGDAPSLEEAASADGVIELAKRYGYGDWDDDDDDGDDDDNEEEEEAQRKSMKFLNENPPWRESSRGRRRHSRASAAVKSASTKRTKRTAHKKVSSSSSSASSFSRPRTAGTQKKGNKTSSSRADTVTQRSRKTVEVRRRMTSEASSTATPPASSKRTRTTAATMTRHAARNVVEIRRGITAKSASETSSEPRSGAASSLKRTVDETKKLGVRRGTAAPNDLKSRSTTTMPKRPTLVVRPKGDSAHTAAQKQQKEDKT